MNRRQGRKGLTQGPPNWRKNCEEYEFERVHAASCLPRRCCVCDVAGRAVAGGRHTQSPGRAPTSFGATSQKAEHVEHQEAVNCREARCTGPHLLLMHRHSLLTDLSFRSRQAAYQKCTAAVGRHVGVEEGSEIKKTRKGRVQAREREAAAATREG